MDWPNLLLHKVAPLCPMLALKLRLVCRHLYAYIEKPKAQYLKLREIYMSPLSAINVGLIIFAGAITSDNGGPGNTTTSRKMQKFFYTFLPNLSYPTHPWIYELEYVNHTIQIGFPLKMLQANCGPIILPHPSQKCCLGCMYLLCHRVNWCWKICENTIRPGYGIIIFDK